MFDKKPSAQDEQLERTITQLEVDMQSISGDSDEYPKMVNQLERLYKLRTQSAPTRVDPNTLIIAGANLLGILVIVCHERVHVIGSKALNFAGKLK